MDVMTIIEGMKLIVFRIVQGMFIIIGLMPIYRVTDAFVNGQIAANNYTQFTDGLGYIDLGVSMVPFIIMGSVIIACIHTYYRAVQQRKYEGQYTQESMYQDNMYR
jgi:hypothetical protein